MADAPAFTATVNSGMVQVATANANRDGTGTLGTLLTMGASGGRLERVSYKAAVTTTAGMLRFFLSVDGGTTKRLIHEMSVAATTPSATVAAAAGAQTLGMILPASAIVYVATEKAEAINVVAEGGNF